MVPLEELTVQLDGLRKWPLVRPALLLALAVFAPLAVFAGFSGYVAWDRRQASMADQSVSLARLLAQAVDRQVRTAMDDAVTLAESPSLDLVDGRPADLAAFEQVARRTWRRHPEWRTVLLQSPEGRWIYSTRSGGGAPDRQIEDRPSFDQVLRTRRPAAGDIVRGANGALGIALRAPVIRDGRLIYVVSVILDPIAVQQTLAGLRMDGPWIRLIVNAQGHVVARLPADPGVLGVLVPAEARAARARGGGGGYDGRTVAGQRTRSFYWASPETGWSTHLAMSRRAYEAPLRQMIAGIVGAFLVCLLLAGGLVVLWLRDYQAGRRQSAAVEQATRIDALGRLTGGVAHDFNNLLTVIRGNSDILSRRLKGDAQAERPLAAIRAATDRAAKLTRQLLVFARGGPAEPATVNLERKVTELTGALSQLVGPGVTVQVQAEPGLPPVSVDPLQLEAALLNLAANARDAMAGSGTLRFVLRRSGAWLALSAEDEGPGFDAGVLSRVFDPFFTTKPVGQGTGLGLSQVYGLVKGAGGRVEAANAPGGGGVVTLYFPPAEEISAAQPQPADDQRPGAPACLLLVDDNDEVRGAAATFLRDCGLGVIEAGDAAAALRVLQDSRIEAVVTDIIMPGEMDGIGLAEALRARRPDLPVLLVSGFSERAAEAQARGFPVMHKPYDLAALEQRLRGLVGRAEAAVQAGQ